MVAYRLNYKTGDLIDSRYRIRKNLGSGSYGDVYLVEDSAGEKFALKLLRLWEVSGELHESLACKFRQEYSVARLSSEYLVHSLAIGEVQGNPYILMEYCPQGDLSKMLGKEVPDLPHYAHDILEGLHALHTAGKIHRDMKPENVLFRPNGKLALTDFGIVGEMDKSKRMSEVGWLKKRPRQALGSPLYMAPEMVERMGGGITYLPTIDLWSFGVMMYELLSGGTFPFGKVEQISDLPKYQERARRGKWDAEKLKNASDSGDWVYIIGKCLEPDYRKRYQSALEVLRDMSDMVEISPEHERERKSRSAHITHIEITQGGNVGVRCNLCDLLTGRGRMLRVGREKTNDIVLMEQGSAYVSRFHFTLERSADGTYWTVRDGQWRKDEHRWSPSTNGTYINATLVTTEGQKLFTGDIITAGEYKLKVE